MRIQPNEQTNKRHEKQITAKTTTTTTPTTKTAREKKVKTKLVA